MSLKWTITVLVDNEVPGVEAVASLEPSALVEPVAVELCVEELVAGAVVVEAIWFWLDLMMMLANC